MFNDWDSLPYRIVYKIGNGFAFIASIIFSIFPLALSHGFRDNAIYKDD
jgi:hypothetical protein